MEICRGIASLCVQAERSEGVVLVCSVKGGYGRRPRVGKWETCFWFSTFPSAVCLSCGNVGISRLLRDFQGTVGRVQNLQLVLHAFHRPGISTDLLFR